MTDTMDIQKIVGEYYEKLYVNKLGNLEEMDKFLETSSLPKLEQGERENLNRPITSNESVVRKLPTNKRRLHR